MTGAAIGVGASMACGPAALFCAALTVPAGLLTGGIVGLSVGASEGASRGISADDAKKLESLLETAQLEHTHPESLAATFKEHASDFWTTTAEDSAVKITLGVAPLRIRQEKRSLIRFQTSISVLVDYGDGSKPRTFTFQRVTPLKSADTLLTDDGALTERVIGDLYKHGIRHVVFALSDSITAYAPRSPSTDESP